MNKYILRECHIIGVLLFHQVTTGIILALPSVMMPAITSSASHNYTDICVSKDQASWFVTVYGLTGPIGFWTLPAIMQLYGRRATHFLLNLILAVGSVTIACSNSITGLIIGRGIHGLAFPGVIITCIIVAEYTHPKRRGFFIVFKLVVTLAGELVCRSLSLVLTWRQIVWLSSCLPVLGMIGTFTWLESPAWLALRGRYKDCAKSFAHFRGRSVTAKEELEELLASQKELRKICADYGLSFRALLKAFNSKEFLKPLLTSGLLVVLIQASGNYFFPPYLIEIMKKITKSSTKAYYFSIGADTIQILALLLTSFMIEIFKRRTLLFVFGSLAVAVLGLTCISNYLEVKGVFLVNWLTPLLLIVYIFLSKVSFLAVSVVSKGEIFPLQYRGLGVCVSGTIMAVCAATVLKLTGVMIYSIGVHGMLAVYLVACVVLMIGLFFVLPETKDRTLQNIENDFFKLSVKTCNDDNQTKSFVVHEDNKK